MLGAWERGGRDKLISQFCTRDPTMWGGGMDRTGQNLHTVPQSSSGFLSTLHHRVAKFLRPSPDKIPTLKFHDSQLRFQAP